jgi:hypothetical protein
MLKPKKAGQKPMKGFIMKNITEQFEKISQELYVLKQLGALHEEFEARVELGMYSEELVNILRKSISEALKMVDIDLEVASVLAMSIARNMYM